MIDEPKPDRSGAGAPPIFQAFAEIQRLYGEILHAVAHVHPGETKHQTALRYIREAEDKAAMDALPAKDALPVPGPHGLCPP